ncbi:MAG: FtsX-like permease family protein [Cyclobacteriaceae bacterium]|nr:FtsX-like permease family protein [Cyclobacteriaceae bacterium]
METIHMLIYLLLDNHTSFDLFAEKFRTFNDKLVNEIKHELEAFVPQPIKDIHLYSDKFFEPEVHGSASEVFFLLGVAFLVIIIAMVNYINLTTSKALDRAKEIGIRKVVGSTKSQIRTQFMVESFLINLIAGGVALAIILAVLPIFKEISGLPATLRFVSDLNFWLLILVFVVASAIFLGIFPAFILSSFKLVSVLKGKLGHSTLGIRLRKGLVVFSVCNHHSAPCSNIDGT